MKDLQTVDQNLYFVDRKQMNLPFEKTHTIMGKWGYTGSACIPMVLDDAIKAGKLKRGDKFIMCASGGGMNMAAMIFQY